MSRRDNATLYTAAYVRIYPKDSSEVEFAQVLRELKIDRFFTPDCNITIKGFNKPSTGHVLIPMLDSYSDLGQETNKNNIVFKEIETYRKRRDILQKYLLEHKWLALEIYFCESDKPIDYDRDVKRVKIGQKSSNLKEDIRAYKVFDGLGHRFRLQYNSSGHTISMDVTDRLALFDAIMDGKVKNTNSEALLKTICDNAGLNLYINKGINFKQNLFISNNKGINPYGVSNDNFKLLNQNLGTHGHSLENKTLSDNFLLNARKVSDVVRDIAKIESAVYYCVGNNFYFGGIDKEQFQNLIYTYGENVFSCDIDIVLPKPLKEDDSQYPFYIELKSFNAANKEPLIAVRGNLPPKATKYNETDNNKNKNLEPNATNAFTYADTIDSKAKAGKKLDESAKTIYVYESYLGLSKKQLENMANAIQYALEHGALQGDVEIPVDYSVSPFDTLQIKNLGKDIEKYIFNIQDVEYRFNTKSGISQTLKITTGHDSIFEGKIKDQFFPKGSATSESLGDINADNAFKYGDKVNGEGANGSAAAANSNENSTAPGTTETAEPTNAYEGSEGSTGLGEEGQ